MKFFKSTQSSPPAESAAAVERLNSIVGRGQAELKLYSKTKEPVEPERVQRRFWTPDELPEASHSA